MVSGEKRDYLMMQIEELGRVLGKILTHILDLKSSTNVIDYKQEISQIFLSETIVDFPFILNSCKNEFEDYISDKFSNHSELYVSLAQILYELSGLESNNQKKIELYEKALILYQLSIDISKTFNVEVFNKMKLIHSLLTKLKSTE
mgnify:CR=1 FL=1